MNNEDSDFEVVLYSINVDSDLWAYENRESYNAIVQEVKVLFLRQCPQYKDVLFSFVLEELSSLNNEEGE